MVSGRSLLQRRNELAGRQRGELVVADVIEIVLRVGVGLEHSPVVRSPRSDPAGDDGYNGQCSKKNDGRYGVY